MAFTAPYGQHNYVGEFNSDANATAGVVVLGWDAAGSPQVGQVYYNTASASFRYWDGANWQSLMSLEGISNTLFVDVTASTYTADGSVQHPYNSLTAALADVGLGAGDVIVVYPGAYNEAITIPGLANLSIVGIGGWQGTMVFHAAATVLSVTNAASAGLYVQGITFQSDGANAIAAFGAGGGVSDVAFESCRFVGDGANDTSCVGFTSATTSWYFSQCTFEHAGEANTILTFGVSSNLDTNFEVCMFAGRVAIGVVSTVIARACVFSGDLNGSATIVMNGGTLYLIGCYVVNANAGDDTIHIDNAATALYLIGNVLIPSATGYAIDGTANCTVGVVSGNYMTGYGMSSRMQPTTQREYRAGSGARTDWYRELYYAYLAAGSALGPVVIKLFEDQTMAAPIVFSTTVDVVIDGQGIYSITRVDDDIAWVAANVKLEFRDVFLEGSVEMTGASGNRLILRRVQMHGGINVAAGTGATTYVEVIDSVILGDGDLAFGGYAIFIADADPVFQLVNSYFQGDTGDEAVWWASVDNDNLQARRCTFIHGDVGANDPFGAAGGVTPNFTACACEFNEEPDPLVWTNDIDPGQRNNSYDPDVAWYWTVAR